jgi:hypothetical protein
MLGPGPRPGGAHTPPPPKPLYQHHSPTTLDSSTHNVLPQAATQAKSHTSSPPHSPPPSHTQSADRLGFGIATLEQHIIERRLQRERASEPSEPYSRWRHRISAAGLLPPHAPYAKVIRSSQPPSRWLWPGRREGEQTRRPRARACCARRLEREKKKIRLRQCMPSTGR